jgi:hypothetical protein
MTGNGYDQVVRKAAFLVRHPDAEFTGPRRSLTGRWHVRVPSADGDIEISRYELKDLLDYLEWRFDS